MAVDDPADRGQTDARAGKLVPGVQALESAEELPRIGHIETDAVVADEEGPSAVDVRRAKFDPGLRASGRELPGIVEEVVQDDPEQALVAAGFQPGRDDDTDGSVAARRRLES